MQYLKELMDERSIENSVPYNDVLEGNYKGANYVQCLKGDNFVYIYIPYGLSVKVNLEKIKQETVNAYWFNPRNGDRNYIATFECNHVEVFNPKSHGRNHDWVLIFV